MPECKSAPVAAPAPVGPFMVYFDFDRSAITATARKTLADKGYDSHAILDAVEACGAQPIIPQCSQMKRTRAFDARLYKKCNLVERTINKRKHFRRIAIRYDRKPANFMAFLCLATLPVWLPRDVESA